MRKIICSLMLFLLLSSITFAASSGAVSPSFKLHSDVMRAEVASAVIAKDSALIGPESGLKEAVVRTSAVKRVGEVVSVLDFGAIPNDGMSDAAAFNAAIDYANSASTTGSSGMGMFGLTILIPDGLYDIPVGLTSYVMKDNITIRGESADGSMVMGGRGTIFKFGAEADATTVNGGGVQNIKFMYAVPDASAVAIDIPNAVRQKFSGIRARNSNVLVRLGSATKTAISISFSDVAGWAYNSGLPTFQLVNGAGFYLSDAYFFVQNVSVPIVWDAHAVLAGTDFIQSVGGWDTVVVNQVTCNRYDRSFYVSVPSGKSVTNWKIEQFYGDYSAHGAIFETQVGASGGSISHISFSHAWFVGTVGNSFTLQVLDATLGSIQKVDLSDVEFMLSGVDGLHVSGPATSIKYVNITRSKTQGNALSGVGAGIYLDGVADFNLTDNFAGLSSSGFAPLAGQAVSGIQILSTNRRFNVQGNHSTGAFTDYVIQNPAVSPQGCLVRGNFKLDGGLPSYAVAAIATPPASGIDDTNASPFEVVAYSYGGTVASTRLNGTKISDAGNVQMILRPGDRWSSVYTAAPVYYRQVMP